MKSQLTKEIAKMKHIKKIEIILTLIIGAILISFLFAANAISSPNTNLKITRLKLDKSSISPNEAVNLTYWLKPEGMIHACFNMGIDVKKGEREKRLESWGLPSKLCDDLRQGLTISQTWQVKIPNWGSGTYVISIYADVDNYLKESNRDDNRMEKTLVVRDQSFSGDFERDTDRAGSDYKNFDLPRADPELCRDACTADSRCKAWTYVKPDTTQCPRPRCWLKNRVPPPTRNTSCISGVKPLPLSGGDLSVRFVRKLLYNPPKRYIPGVEDKAGYWYQKDYGMVEAFDFEMRNHLLAAVIEESGGPTRLFIINWKTGDIAKRVTLSPNKGIGIESVKFSPDGKTIAVATGQDREIMLWNVRSGTLIDKKRTDAPAGSVDWHPDGKMLAVAAKEYIEIWEVDPLNRKKSVRGARTPNIGWTMSSQWSPDGNYLAIGTNEPAVYIHHYGLGRQSGTLVPKPKGSVYMVAWNSDGNLLASAGFGRGGTIKIWKDPKKAVDVPHGKKYQMIREFNPSHSPGVEWWTKMIWDPSGRVLAFGDNQSNFLFQDISSGSLLKKFIPHKGSTTMEAHWKGDYLITLGSYPDKTFRVWKVDVRR